MGRPTTYTPELAAKVCEVIRNAKGGMRKTLEEHKELPAYGTVLGWADRNVEFSTNLARAREQRLRSWVEDMVDLADDDTIDPADKRIRVDTRKWILSKELHKVYGDKLDVTSGGEAIKIDGAQIDARVQSIIMTARARQQAIEELPPEVKGLLE